jgi:ribosome-associated protein
MAQPLPEPAEETTPSNVRPLKRARRTTGPKPAAAKATATVTRPRAPRVSPASRAASKPEPDPLDVAREIVRLASDKGAADILLMDIRKLSIIADYFVICSGDNERQIRAINRGITEGVDERWDFHPLNRRPGVEAEQAGWVVLDYGSVIVHIFSPQMREFYRLERLWSEAATLLRMQ